MKLKSMIQSSFFGDAFQRSTHIKKKSHPYTHLPYDNKNYAGIPFNINVASAKEQYW